MSNIRTITGDVSTETIVGVDAHDHMFLRLPQHLAEHAVCLLESVTEAVDELSAFRAAGGGAVVCATPIGLGRSPAAMVRAASATDVALVATTGFHKLAYYEASHWVHSLPLCMIAQLVADEVEYGIDSADYRAPFVTRTQVRPGIVKAGSGLHQLCARERALHQVAAEVARTAGLPMLLHVEGGAAPHPALDVVEAAGLSLDRVLVSHLDRNIDLALHRSVAARGAFLVYDGLFREAQRPVSDVLGLISALGEAGYGDRILVGGDLARRAYRRVSGAPGLAGLLTGLAVRIETELGPGIRHQLMTHNPRRALTLHSGEAPSSSRIEPQPTSPEGPPT